MTLKTRVKKLETGGAASSSLEGISERLMSALRKNAALKQKLDAMTEPELVDLAFDITGDRREREEALKRLRGSGIDQVRLLDARIQIKEAAIKQMSARAGDLVGQERKLNQQIITAHERMLEDLRNEKAEIN